MHGKSPKDQKYSNRDVAVVKEGYESSNVLLVATNSTEKLWILDSGCSFHMIPNKDWFISFKSINGRQVLIGNNKAYKIARIGTFRFKLHDGIERLLNNI